IIVTAMLRNMAQNDQQRLIDQVEGALYEVKPDASIPDDDTELLRDYVKKLLRHPRQ
ncbi:TPA: sigma-S stabilization anti-adapter protein IraP, partial [Escherichia coli]|nr:anti-adapter protein IraP [Escherichia coli]